MNDQETPVDPSAYRIQEAARRLPAVTRYEMLFKEIVRMAREDYNGLTREAIAARCNVSVGTVSHYFGKMPQLKFTVMTYAVSKSDIKTIGLGLGVKDPVALAAPEHLRKRAAALLAE